MNRLILIGNGFDLAHGMKTSYNNFILWYLKKCCEEAYSRGSYSDKLIQIVENRGYGFGSLKDVDGFINYHYKNSFKDFERENLQNVGAFNTFTNPFNIRLNSSFFQKLLSNCSYTKWVEIENEFYDQLKDIFTLDIGKESGSAYEERNKRRLDNLKSLNESLQIVIKELEIYLSTIESNSSIGSYKDIFNSVVKKEDILITNSLSADEKPIESLVLNFNYISTSECILISSNLALISTIYTEKLMI